MNDTDRPVGNSRRIRAAFRALRAPSLRIIQRRTWISVWRTA